MRYPRYISIFVAFYCCCCFPLFPYSFNATNMNLSMSGLHCCSSPLLSSIKWSSSPKNSEEYHISTKISKFCRILGWTLGFKEFYVSTNNPHVNSSRVTMQSYIKFMIPKLVLPWKNPSIFGRVFRGLSLSPRHKELQTLEVVELEDGKPLPSPFPEFEFEQRGSFSFSFQSFWITCQKRSFGVSVP